MSQAMSSGHATPILTAQSPVAIDLPPEIGIEIDARGSFFPAALVELVRVVRDCAPGDHVALLVTDPAAHQEIPAWAQRRGHEVLTIEPCADATTIPPRSYLRVVVQVGART